MKLSPRTALAALGLCTWAFNVHSLSGGPVTGHVIDETSGKPVGDAIVVVHWNGSWTKLAAESSSACYHVETARTDANGRFETAAWKTSWAFEDLRFSSDGQSYHVYKPGYIRGGNYAAAPKTLYMAPYKGSAAYYFQHVLSAPFWGCSRAGASSKNEYRLFKAMTQEAETLAETPDQKGRAWMLRRLTEASLINFDKPTRSVGDRSENVDPRDGFKKDEVPQ